MRSTKYIDLLLNEDYPTVIEKTENGNTSLQENYNNIALVLRRFQDVTGKEMIEEK